MSQDTQIGLECTVCKRRTYNAHKNKKTIKGRLEMSKHCRFCKVHTPHKETK